MRTQGLKSYALGCDWGRQLKTYCDVTVEENECYCEKLHTQTDFGDYFLTLVQLKNISYFWFGKLSFPSFSFSGCHLTIKIKDPSVLTYMFSRSIKFCLCAHSELSKS